MLVTRPCIARAGWSTEYGESIHGLFLCWWLHQYNNHQFVCYRGAHNACLGIPGARPHFIIAQCTRIPTSACMTCMAIQGSSLTSGLFVSTLLLHSTQNCLASFLVDPAEPECRELRAATVVTPAEREYVCPNPNSSLDGMGAGRPVRSHPIIPLGALLCQIRGTPLARHREHGPGVLKHDPVT